MGKILSDCWWWRYRLVQISLVLKYRDEWMNVTFGSKAIRKPRGKERKKMWIWKNGAAVKAREKNGTRKCGYQRFIFRSFVEDYCFSFLFVTFFCTKHVRLEYMFDTKKWDRSNTNGKYSPLRVSIVRPSQSWYNCFGHNTRQYGRHYFVADWLLEAVRSWRFVVTFHSEIFPFFTSRTWFWTLEKAHNPTWVHFVHVKVEWPSTCW